MVWLSSSIRSNLRQLFTILRFPNPWNPPGPFSFAWLSTSFSQKTSLHRSLRPCLKHVLLCPIHLIRCDLIIPIIFGSWYILLNLWSVLSYPTYLFFSLICFSIFFFGTDLSYFLNPCLINMSLMPIRSRDAI